MYSTPSFVILGIAALALTAGCQATWTAPQPVNQTPLVVDEAMQLRDWPQMAVQYPSTGIVAGPVIGFPWQEQTYRGARWEPTYTAQPPLEVMPY